MQNSVFKALAHPLRRELLSILRADARLAGDLADMFDVSWPTVSRHLSVLKEADLVITERNGNQILYRLNTSVVQDAAAILLGLAGVSAAEPEAIQSEINFEAQRPHGKKGAKREDLNTTKRRQT
jgi:DNA-binding transcriptional ArsR family regulator